VELDGAGAQEARLADLAGGSPRRHQQGDLQSWGVRCSRIAASYSTALLVTVPVLGLLVSPAHFLAGPPGRKGQVGAVVDARPTERAWLAAVDTRHQVAAAAAPR
jgi:hypothetical protein